MLIFNKRSSSSSDKGNKYLETTTANQAQSTLLRQDFIDFNNSFGNGNGNGNEDDQYNKASALNGQLTNGSAANGGGISTIDDTISVEEPHEGYVYQITIKKVYNKSLQSEETKTAAAKSNNNIYGTYRPTSSFFSYVSSQDSANSQSATTSSSTVHTNQASAGQSAKDGLIYTRVKLKQLKYATLPKFIEHLTNEETGSLDATLVHIFLVTYRTFTDTATAIRMIQRRYEQVLPASLEMTEDVRVEHLRSIRAILFMWLENYIEDFNEPPDYTNLNVLKTFATKHLANTEIMHIIQAKFSYFENLANSSQISNSNSLLSIKIQHSEPDGTTATASTPAAANNNNQLQTSFASTSQFSLSPTNSTTSYTSTSLASNNRPPHSGPNSNNNSHRRSFSNIPPIRKSSTSTSIVAEFNPSNVNANKQNRTLAPSPTLNHSKSQTNLNGMSKSPILNLIANSLSIKSGSALVSATNPNALLESTFMQIDSQYLAEQLTYIDKCLFPRVCAHLCLGGVWSTRYRKTASELNNTETRGTNSPTTVSVNSNNSTPILSDKFATIGAFIDQFNCVSFVVQATVLENTDLKSSDRAKIIKKWIEVAIACRAYKNFSSLNAIVQGLNTQCVSRLHKTWNEIPSEIKAQFAELTQMFSEDQNQKEFRSILARDLEDYSQMFDVNDKLPAMGFTGMTNSLIQKQLSLENAASSSNNNNKYADINSGINVTLGRKYKESMKKQIKSQLREPLGTIPFLGTFLKDLEYLNAQNPKSGKGMINVLQKRREFEIISQIKLLQHAAQLYNIKSNPEFKTWLQKQTVYSEEQNYNMSYAIEPRDIDIEGSLNNGANRKSKTNSGLLSESTDSLLSYNKTPQSDKKRFNSSHSRHSSYGGNSNSELNPTSASNLLQSITSDSSIRNSTDGYFTIQKSSKSSLSSDKMNVKVIIEFNNPNEVLKNDERVVANTVIYKKIYIKDSDRTKDVKKAILEKFFLDPETCDKFGLVQVFSQPNTKELPIGDNCNVYYAAKNVQDMQFVLRRRKSLSGERRTSIPNASGNNNTMNSAQFNNSPPKSSPMANTYRSPVLNKANKLAKKIGRSKTQQIIAQPQSQRNLNDLPPHYPNHK